MNKIINILAIIPFFLVGLHAFGQDKVPTFSGGELHSTNGASSLSWQGVELGDGEFYEVFEFSEMGDATSGPVYKGIMPSAFLSGLENGAHYFKVRVNNINGATHPWSEPLILDVKHHSLQFAFTLFFIGAIVFASIVFVIARGER